jgi:ribokinase
VQSRVAVVGHVEWIEFVRVDRLPAAGEIVHARDVWAEPGGGGAVTAVQLARLAGACTFFTAIGGDELGARARAGLQELGVRVEAAVRNEPQRRAVVFVDGAGERTITLLSHKLRPVGADDLPWRELEGLDAVYFTGGDEDALRFARGARTLVATARELPTLAAAGVAIDVLVRSATDEGERYEPGGLRPEPGLVVATKGAEGGTYTVAGGSEQSFRAPELPGPVVDAYGAGDSFAAGLTYAVAGGADAPRAIAFAARCGAAVMTGRGPYAARLPR